MYREYRDTYVAKYDSPMTAYLSDLANDGGEDEGGGDAIDWHYYVSRVGRRIVMTESSGFVSSWRCASEDAASAEFAEFLADWYAMDEEN